MNRIQKEYLVIATNFTSQFVEDHAITNKTKMYADVWEMYQFLGKQSAMEIKTETTVRELSESVFAKLLDITNKEDVSVNMLAIALQGLFMLIEEDAFKWSAKLTAKRLTNGIYEKMEEIHGTNDGFKNAQKVLARLADYNEEIA